MFEGSVRIASRVGCALLVTTTVGGVARADPIVDGFARTSIQVMSGVFDFGFAAPRQETATDAPEFASDLRGSPPGPFPASARARMLARRILAGGSVELNAAGSAEAMAPGVPDPPASNLFAVAELVYVSNITATQRTSVTASAQVLGGAPDAVAIGGPNVFRSGPSASASMTLEAGETCTLSLVLSIRRSGNREFLDPGEASGSFSASLSAVELPPEETGNEFVWIGGPGGSFNQSTNWDPEGVPGSDDTAIFSQGGSAAVDLAGPAALVLQQGVAFPVEVLVERVRVNLNPMRPNAGVLRLLSPAFAEPSLVVNSGGRLLIDNGSVAAQTALIGEDGLGTVEVTAGMLFQTDGRLVIGRDGEGRLHVTGGANAITDEVILGEGTGPGNALVAGEGSLWIANRLVVSQQEPSTIQLFAGGQLETTEAIVDRAPQGELPNVTVDQSATWLVDRLAIAGRGVVECSGGTIDGRDPGPGEMIIGSTSPGTARLVVSSGGTVRTRGDLIVGRSGSGHIRVDGSNQASTLRVDGALRVGLQGLDRGDVELLSTITTGGERLIAASLELFHGKLTLQHAALCTIQGSASIGEVGGVRTASASLLGNGPPGLTRLLVGVNTRVATRLLLRNATLVTGSLDVEPDALVVGEGDGNVIDAVSGILNRGTLSGRITLAPGTNILSQSTGIVQLQQFGPSSPSPSSVQAERAAAAGRAGRAPASLPPNGRLELLGDGELAGTIVIQFQNGYAPRLGDRIEAVRAAGALTGEVDFEVRGLEAGASFEFDVDAAGGEVSFVALNDAIALPTVSITASPILSEKKKSGKVTVTRTGDLTSPLLVHYTIQGSAVNGLDYQRLSGVIEFPARKKAVKLLVKPFLDGLLEPTETIELEIVPGEAYTPSVQSKIQIALQDQVAPKAKKKKQKE